MIRYGNVYMTITEYVQRLPVYLTCIGKWSSQYAILREEGWPDYQWVQFTKGEGVLKVGGKEYKIGERQGMLLFPNETHEYFPVSEPWESHWFSFNGTYTKELLGSIDLTCSQVLYLTNPDPLLNKMYRLLTVSSAVDPMNYLECSAITYDLIFDLYRYGSQSNVRSKQQYFAQLSPVFQYIDNNFHKPITLDVLAHLLYITPQHTCLLFKQALGMRPFEFINTVRLRKAKELLLQEPDIEISELGRMVGFESPSYFIKVFRKYEGTTPKQFRSFYKGATVSNAQFE